MRKILQTKRLLLLMAICLIYSVEAFAQSIITVKGQVLDDKKTPIVGAMVLIKGTSKGTMTDVDGNFVLSDVANNATIRVSYVGMSSKELMLKGRKQVLIVLKEDSELLNDLVVVGYGSKKKVNLTGAVASVDTKKMRSRPTGSIMGVLQGTVPGVTIIDRPGGSTSLNIRGRGNLGSSNPLYIVDGIEVSASFFNSLNPDNIENISFLKDASSAAIYGAKAAFGVVLVTTKNAKEGQLQVSYSGLAGVKTPSYLPDIVNSGQYAEMYNLAEMNGGKKVGNLTFSEEAIRKYYDGSDPDRYPNTNWFDLILRNRSLFTKHNLQFAGGSKMFKYILNTGFLRDEGLFPRQASNRYDVSAKTVADLRPWLRITSSANFIYNKFNNDGGRVSVINMLRVPPTGSKAD